MVDFLVKGFSAVRPRNNSELHSARKSDALLRAGCHEQWDIFEVRPDHAKPNVHHKWDKDSNRPSLPERPHASGRYRTFIFHVPSISIGNKEFIEQQGKVWPACGEEVWMLLHREMRDGPKPLDETRRSFYFDYDSLPDHAKSSLLSEGDCTLTEVEARASLRHKFDQSLVSKLFTEFVISG